MFGQKLLFNTPKSENSLSENQKITKDLTETYTFTKYFQQSTFDLNSDLEFDISSENQVTAKHSKTITYSNGSFSSVYTIKDPDAELVFSKWGDIITGMYLTENGKKYIFHQTSSNIFSISEVNESQFNSKQSQLDFITPEFLEQKLNNNVCLEATAVCQASTIDVLVVYTTAAKTAWGGAPQSNSFIATSITNFNNALANSGVSNVTINLVYTGEVICKYKYFTL